MNRLDVSAERSWWDGTAVAAMNVSVVAREYITTLSAEVAGALIDNRIECGSAHRHTPASGAGSVDLRLRCCSILVSQMS